MVGCREGTMAEAVEEKRKDIDRCSILFGESLEAQRARTASRRIVIQIPPAAPYRSHPTDILPKTRHPPPYWYKVCSRYKAGDQRGFSRTAHAPGREPKTCIPLQGNIPRRRESPRSPYTYH